jgi:hypothetical protein
MKKTNKDEQGKAYFGGDEVVRWCERKAEPR